MYRSVMSSRGRITIPVELRKKFGMKPGTQVSWKEEKGKLVLTRVTSRPKRKS
jgi:AbrB family looped-hinge helix DNA binding protein